MPAVLKCHEQKRHEVVDYRLNYVSCETGIHGTSVLHAMYLPSFVLQAFILAHEGREYKHLLVQMQRNGRHRMF